MVRAGGKGVYLDEFLSGEFVAVGWEDVGDLTNATTRDAIKAQVTEALPHLKPLQLVSPVGCLHKIRNRIDVGDPVITYDPSARMYHLGEIAGAYQHVSDGNPDLVARRAVNWTDQIHRDSLTDKAKYSLGSLLAIFEIPEPTWDEIQALRSSGNSKAATPAQSEVGPAGSEDDDELLAQDPVEDAIERAHESRKDAINRLAPDEMEEFVAGVMRGMGYRARVSPTGPDRGCDIEASPDGLGLEEPRIRIEVKHRSGPLGAPILRSFLAALRPGDKGLFVSTGGVTREAKYEAERSQVPVTLVDLDRLAELYIEFYEELRPEDRALVPLTRVYWPKQSS